MFGKGLERSGAARKQTQGHWLIVQVHTIAHKAAFSLRWYIHQTQLRNISPYTQETSWHLLQSLAARWEQYEQCTVCMRVHTPRLAKWPLCHHVADGLVQLFTHMCVVVYSLIHSVEFTHMYIDGTLVYLHVRSVVHLFTHNWFCRPLL